MTEYSAAFKANMVRKMLLPGGVSATSLSTTTGIPQPTLSRWLRDAKESDMPTPAKTPPRPARRPSDWKAEEKLRVLKDAEGLTGTALGELLRREGLHEADLEAWRRAALVALGGDAKPAASSSEARRVRELEKQLLRKDRALAEAAALLVLQKKVQELWGDEDDDTKRETGR